MAYPVAAQDTVITRTSKGTPLTTAEMDSNIDLIPSISVPVGMVVDWFGAEADLPTAGSNGRGEYLPCDGRLISTATYPGLLAILGTKFGAASGQFGLPDLRGYFMRMVDTTTEGSAGRDPDEATRTAPAGGTTADTGSTQSFATQEVLGSFQRAGVYGSDRLLTDWTGAFTDGGYVESRWGHAEGRQTQGKWLANFSNEDGGAVIALEDRPKNMYVMKVMRVR